MHTGRKLSHFSGDLCQSGDELAGWLDDGGEPGIFGAMTNPIIDSPQHPNPPELERIVLASASPRRREILKGAGIRFEVINPQIEELVEPGEDPQQVVLRLAREKAQAVAAQIGRADGRLVLGADTIVVLGDTVLGKPNDPEHAVAMLRRLAGQRHRVMTGIAVANARTLDCRSRAVTSWVTLRAAADEEIRVYVASGEPLDKAGGYAIQGEGGRRFATRLEGSESNVIGLPIDETLALLREMQAARRATP